MALTECSNINVIQALADQPPLTAPQLKAKFDEGCNIIKDYINVYLTKEIDSAIAAINNILGGVTVEQLACLAGLSINILTLLSQKQNNVTYSTGAPSALEGDNGDVYLRYS